jgi:transposase
VVHSAKLMDRDEARLVLVPAKVVGERLQLIWADMGYGGQGLKEWIEKECKWQLEIVKRPFRWGRYPVEVEPPLGCRKNLCLDWSVQTNEQRL